eukprot:scaffold319684_cov27-Prasinocladus_malaysianus.AAC.1
MFANRSVVAQLLRVRAPTHSDYTSNIWAGDSRLLSQTLNKTVIFSVLQLVLYLYEYSYCTVASPHDT